MKRLALVSVASLLAFGCADQPEMTSGPIGGPQLAIMDATQPDGNTHFFWLSPLVPQPKTSDFNGPFDPLVQPSIEICELVQETENGPWQCEGGRANIIERFEFGPGGIVVEDGTEHYHVNWDLPNNLTGRYRVFALVGRSRTPQGDPAPEQVLREFGYRDIEVDGTGGDDDPFYGVNRGSTVPIKFRIEEGAICDGLIECAAGTVTAAASSFLTEYEDAGIFVDEFTLPTGELVTIKFEKLTIGDPGREACIAFGTPGQGDFLPLDLAQYPDCFKVTTFPKDVQWEKYLTFGTCYIHEGQMIWDGDDDDQPDRARLYRAEDDGSNVQIMDFVHVHLPGCRNPVPPPPNPIMGFARGLLRKVAEPFVPTPLFASPAFTHLGLGGRGAGSIIGVAMPASLKPSGDTDLGVVPVGETTDVRLTVNDAGGQPVMRSSVTFAPADERSSLEFMGDFAELCSGDATEISCSTAGVAGSGDGTGNAGGAGVSWRLEDAGLHTLVAYGVGYATPPVTGVPDHPMDILRDPFEVEFTVLACDIPDGGAVDGEIKTGEYPDENDESFPVNISGDNDASAVLHFRNDCWNLYLGLDVAREGDEKVNSWRIDIDGENDGRTVEDDIMIVDVIDGFAEVRDMWLTSSCLNRKQASCGGEDVATPTDKEAAFGTDANGHWIYEVAIPLSNDYPAEDLSVALGTGAKIGVSITLQIGNGAQGNTQVPGFKEYFEYTIVP